MHSWSKGQGADKTGGAENRVSLTQSGGEGEGTGEGE